MRPSTKVTDGPGCGDYCEDYLAPTLAVAGITTALAAANWALWQSGYYSFQLLLINVSLPCVAGVALCGSTCCAEEPGDNHIRNLERAEDHDLMTCPTCGEQGMMECYYYNSRTQTAAGALPSVRIPRLSK